MFRFFGIPQDIVTNRGPQFSSRFWHAFCLATTMSLSSGFHPESNGQIERLNQDLETTLRCMTANNLTSWALFGTVWAGYAHNTPQLLECPSLSAGFVFKPTLFPDQEAEVGVSSALCFVRCCRLTWRRARLRLLQTFQQYECQVYCHR